MIGLWVGAVAWAAPWDAPCATRPTGAEVQALAGETVLLRVADLEAAADAEVRLREAVRCTQEVLSPQVAARVVRAVWPGDPLRVWTDAPGVSFLDVPGQSYVDGLPTTARPIHRPAVVQVVAEPPEVARWSGILAPDEDPPAFRMSASGALIGPRRAWLGTPSRRLAFAGGLAGVGSAAFLGVAARSRSIYLDQPASADPDPTALRVNRASAGAGLGLGALGVGLVTTALVRGEF